MKFRQLCCTLLLVGIGQGAGLSQEKDVPVMGTLRVELIDEAEDGTPHKIWVEKKHDLAQPIRLQGPDRAAFSLEGAEGVLQTHYQGRITGFWEDRATVDFQVTLNETIRDDENVGEIIEQTTEHRFRYQGKSGQTEVFQLSPFQRAELTFTWVKRPLWKRVLKALPQANP